MIFKERQAWYEEVASQIVDVSSLNPDEIIEELEMKIAYLGPKGVFFAPCGANGFSS